MDVLLQEHGANHVCKVPEGLRELCTDLAREVLRSQPRNIYCFIADYVEALLITRENAKVALKVVDNILSESQAILAILRRSGLSIEDIVRVSPKVQKAFRAYLDTMDVRTNQVCNDTSCYDAKSELSLRDILEETGITQSQAEEAARIIQSAFRAHYERMLLNESQGMVQWQRAAARTMEILRRTGASRAEASKAAILIQATYRGYYTRKNTRMNAERAAQEAKADEVDTTESKGAIQAVTWLDTMYEESGLTQARANEAASVIQKAYKRYRVRRGNYDATTEPTEAVEAIPEVAQAGVQPSKSAIRSGRAPPTVKEYEVEKIGRPEESDGSRPKRLVDDDIVYSSDVAEDREAAREIEVGPEREDETYEHTRAPGSTRVALQLR